MSIPARVVCVFGTRPDAVKMAPVVPALHFFFYFMAIIAIGVGVGIADASAAITRRIGWGSPTSGGLLACALGRLDALSNLRRALVQYRHDRLEEEPLQDEQQDQEVDRVDDNADRV